MAAPQHRRRSECAGEDAGRRHALRGRVPSGGSGTVSGPAHAHAVQQSGIGRRIRDRRGQARLRRCAAGRARAVRIGRELQSLPAGSERRARYDRMAGRPAVCQREGRHIRPLLSGSGAVDDGDDPAAASRRDGARDDVRQRAALHPPRRHLRVADPELAHAEAGEGAQAARSRLPVDRGDTKGGRRASRGMADAPAAPRPSGHEGLPGLA